MKNILILLFAIATLTAGGQTITQDGNIGIGTIPPSKELVVKSPTITVTVKDTTLRQDARINFLISTILPAIDKHFSEEMARQKINGEVTAEAETQAFFVDLQTAVNKYAQAFIQVNEVQVDPNQIVTEFNELNAKIQTLQSDPEIKYIEAMQEFKTIQEWQAKLAKYYEQVQAQEVKYPAWAQPLGAHDAYSVGAKVTHKEKVWENITPANVWEPGVSGWREVSK